MAVVVAAGGGEEEEEDDAQLKEMEQVQTILQIRKAMTTPRPTTTTVQGSVWHLASRGEGPSCICLHGTRLRARVKRCIAAV